MPAASRACQRHALAGRASAGARRTPDRPDSSRLGTAQPDVILQKHPAARPSQRSLLRLVEARAVRGNRHPAPEPQDALQVSPPGRIPRTVQSFVIGSKKITALPARQLTKNPLRVQRILMMLNRLGNHAVMVRRAASELTSQRPRANNDPG